MSDNSTIQDPGPKKSKLSRIGVGLRRLRLLAVVLLIFAGGLLASNEWGSSKVEWKPFVELPAEPSQQQLDEVKANLLRQNKHDLIAARNGDFESLSPVSAIIGREMMRQSRLSKDEYLRQLQTRLELSEEPTSAEVYAMAKLIPIEMNMKRRAQYGEYWVDKVFKACILTFGPAMAFLLVLQILLRVGRWLLVVD